MYEPGRSEGMLVRRMSSEPQTELDSSVDQAVPDALLLPLLEVAADVLKSLDPVDVPGSLRPLHGFERRRMLAGPGPRQIRRAISADAAFREQVVEQFLARPEVDAMLGAWTAETAAVSAADAAGRGDLAIYTSALWAAQPDGHAFGLGVAVVLDGQHRDRRRDEAEGKSWEQERASLEEARRRADAARLEADTAVARAEQEVQRERAARRSREDEANAGAAVAQRQVDALRTELDQARAECEELQHRASRTAQRAHQLEEDLRRARADARASSATGRSGWNRVSAPGTTER